MTPPDLGGGVVLYAFSLGLVAAVNPCGLPMLPAYLALFTGTTGPTGARVGRSLLTGGTVTAGFVLVFGVLGALVESGVQLVAGWLPWVMIGIGVAMTATGLLTLAGSGPRVRLPVPRLRARRSAPAMLAYGAAYAVGSLSCSLPLFLAAVGTSFTRRGAWAGFSTYVAYALGMGLFVTAAAVVTTTVGAAALRRLRAASRVLPVLSGIVLTVSGAYLVLYWTADLRKTGTGTPVTAAVGRLQGWLTAAVGDDPVRSAVVLGVVVIGAFGLVVRRSLTAPDRASEPGAHAHAHAHGTGRARPAAPTPSTEVPPAP